MEFSYLKNNPLFQGLSAETLQEVLSVLQAQKRSYSRGETIFKEGTDTSFLGIILTGSVTIERVDYLGNRQILSYVGPGQIFAEIYALLDNAPLLVDVHANTDTCILFLNIHLMQGDALKHFYWYPQLLLNLLLITSRKNLELSSRSFHTSSKHVRGRVLSYLTAQAHQHQSSDFQIPFSRQQMADYLNLDRSALSAELSRMRSEGLIDFHKNHFTLHT